MARRRNRNNGISSHLGRSKSRGGIRHQYPYKPGSEPGRLLPTGICICECNDPTGYCGFNQMNYGNEPQCVSDSQCASWCENNYCPDLSDTWCAADWQLVWSHCYPN